MKEKISLLPLSLVLIIYSFFLLNADIISLILYFLNVSISVPVVIFISATITVIVFIRVRRFITVKRQMMDTLSIFFVLVIISLSLVRGILPDVSSDVERAHIFFQQIGFEDNIGFNVFPAGYTFYFYLSDDFAYFFRLILGYRLGTLANAFALVVTFFEIKDLLHEISGEAFTKIRDYLAENIKKSPANAILILGANEGLYAGIACLSYYAISELGTYMIDIVILSLQVLIIKEVVKRTCDSESYQYIFYAFICGLTFAYKQTSIIVIIPALLIYLIKNYKRLSVKVFLVSFVVACIPASPYLIYSYASTGNPVYITYNSIFKSPYYYDVDFKDLRWGPTSIREALGWPIRLVFDYQNRIGEITTMPMPYILMGWYSVCQTILYEVKKRKYTTRNATLIMSSIFIASTMLWLKTTGYARYAIICEIIAVILVAMGIVNRYLIDEHHWKFISLAMLFILVSQCYAYSLGGYANSYDWSWRGSTYSNFKSGVLKDNFKWIFKDRQIGTEEQRNKVDMFLLIANGNAYATLFNADIPIIGAANISQYLGGLESVKGINYVEDYKNYALNMIQSGAGVYDIARLNNLSSCIDLANMWGVEFANIEWMDSFFVYDNELALINYKPIEYGNSYTEIGMVSDIPKTSDFANKFNGYIYLHPYCSSNDYSKLKISILDMDGKETLSENEIIVEGDEVFDLSVLNDTIRVMPYETVKIEILDGVTQVYAINLRLEG